jgi:NADPH-dependent 2,4-dienoyl-CoA reductase/sulfur reductase-like enzyme
VNERAMVIVGAGNAGCRAVQTLRSQGWEGEIHLINAEDRLPYERPPLSKAVLAGVKTTSDLPLLPANWLSHNDVRYHEGIHATRIVRRDQRLLLSDNSTIDYDGLLIATGANSRSLTNLGDLPTGVVTLRSAADSEALARELKDGARVVVIGGGLIGLEVSAAARSLGCEVDIIEAAPRLLMRTIPAEIEIEVRKRHIEAGVRLHFNETVEAILGRPRVTGIRLMSGKAIRCDVALVCIGAQPNVQLAQSCELSIANGVVVDQYLRTSDPQIFAAGDVCCIFNLETGASLRLECWKNAGDQGEVAAKNMLGSQVPFRVVPSMWSDQYENVIRVAGLPSNEQRTVVRELASGAWAVFHLDQQGRLAAVSGYGAIGPVARAVRVGQTMIERGISPEPDALANTADLRTLLQPQQAA